jgi:putative transposase
MMYKLIEANQAHFPIRSLCRVLGVSRSGYYDWKGWAFAEKMTEQIVINALHMALLTRKPESVIHHSDQGSQYTSRAFRERCQKSGVQLSMGSVGDAYDNAMAESFFASLECELIDQQAWKTKTDARKAVFSWIEGWYNPKRLHSAIDYLSPIEFERRNTFTSSSQIHHKNRKMNV